MADGGRLSIVALKRPDPYDVRARHTYLSWDDYFMAVAFLSAERSKDPNKQVGACIVNDENIILSIGYNGFPRGCADSRLPWAKRAESGSILDTKYPYVVHAEANALLNKNQAHVTGARIYVTLFPCNECAKLLIQAGIREVVYHEAKLEPTGKRPGTMEEAAAEEAAADALEEADAGRGSGSSSHCCGDSGCGSSTACGMDAAVRWSFCLRQRVFLNFTNQRRPYQEQALTVWRAHRPLSSGFELSLPVPLNSESAGSGSGAPAFGYVLCLCAARGATAGSAGGPGRTASIATQLMHSKDSNPATATLQQIYTNVDEGVLDPSTLDATAARDLLSRVLLAGDDELLLMLVEAGMGTALRPVCLQQILQYAMLEELPSLAQLVVQSTEVLHWLVPHLLSSGNIARAEVLLGRYCITRRNPLSAVAAIKEAIMKQPEQQCFSYLVSLSFKMPKHDDPWLNPGVGLELMQNMGIAGSGRQPFARAASSLLHAALLAPRALHNSPRGRWLVRCLFEAIFLVMYQAAMMGYVKPLFAGHRWWVVCFIGLVVGNTTDIIFQIHYQHHNNVWRFLSNHAAKLDVLVSVGLLGLLLASIERLALHSGHSLEHELAEEPHTLAAAGLTWLWIAASACAVLVWARALIIILPLSAQLGAMLCTLRKAAEEASVLVPVLVVVVLGFGTTLCAVYQDVVPEYSNLAGSLRMLVAITGGNMDLMDFETHAADNPILKIWGQVIEILYVGVVNVLLMTLLIAIINHTYQPEFVEKETVVMQAETVECYHHQVRHGLAPAPANILQVLLLWLPNGFRVRTQCFKTLWLPFGLDGYAPAAAAAVPELLIATGPAEVGWLAFHCTVFLIASVLALLSLVAHVPFGVLWYARQGHRMWLSDTWGAAALEPDPNSRAGSGRPSTSDPMPQGAATKQPSSMDTSQQLRHFASRNAAALSLRLSGRLGGGQVSWQRARRAAGLGLVAAGSPDTAAKLAMSAPSSSQAAAGGSPRVTFAQSDAADYTFEATVQYIAAMTGLQPARAVPEVAPPLVAPVQQQQVISDSSSSLAPQQSIDGADDHLVL
ncbi:hypothetical protein OEZ85_007602 [Tetradesmus obliquus]|uniref:dCMP deaminase n=1 Tax=Tetradesmus obliquus TaxID=3088 RepID=A0ABY8TJZ2_TETOB|nr:hypothetical protein OEZ85_007602 [Tetradesmus obliquus]